MSRRSVPHISLTDLREHADPEQVERVWQRLEASLPTREARAPRRLGWMAVAAAAAVACAFTGGVAVGRGPGRVNGAAFAIAATGEHGDTDVLAAGEEARSFPLPGGGSITLKPGSTVELQRAGSGGVTLKLVQGDATLDTPASGGSPTMVVGDARLNTQAGSTVSVSRHLDNLEVGVSRGSAVVDSPALTKSLASGEQVSLPLHRAVSAVAASPTAVAAAHHASGHHSESAAPEASVTPGPVAMSSSDWQKASNDGRFEEAARALRAQYGSFDQAIRAAGSAQVLTEMKDLALKAKEPAAESALHRLADEFPSDHYGKLAAYQLCEKLGPSEGQKYCELAKNSPIYDPDAAACRQIAAQKQAGHKDEAARLAREYVKSHADGGGQCRDEVDSIISGGDEPAGAQGVRAKDGGDGKSGSPTKP